MAGQKSRNGKFWCFTDYDVDSSTPPENKLKGFEYLVYQLERCPETKKLHFQGYVCYKSNQRLSALKKFDDKIHWEQRKGKHSQAKDYCMKEESQMSGPWEFGSDENISEGKGDRSDLKDIKEMVDNGKSMLDIAEDHFGSFVRYNKGIQLYKELKDAESSQKQLKIDYSAAILRQWQKVHLKILLEQNDRGVLWIWDSVGNKGKSFFARYLEAMHNAYLITSGKHADIYLAYEYQPVVVLDLSRTHSMDKSLYEIIEGFKNGRIFSSKYQSKSKKFKSAKVLVLCNFRPDYEMISVDRLKVVEIL